jgi:hypothetical protein
VGKLICFCTFSSSPFVSSATHTRLLLIAPAAMTMLWAATTPFLQGQPAWDSFQCCSALTCAYQNGTNMPINFHSGLHSPMGFISGQQQIVSLIKVDYHWKGTVWCTVLQQ